MRLDDTTNASACKYERGGYRNLGYKEPFAVVYVLPSINPNLFVSSPANHRNQYIMKLTTVVLALFSSVALAAPAAQMDKRAVVDATVAVDGLRYRTCPKTTCSAPGQYPKGTKIKLSCYTTSGTTEVNGDK